MRGPRCHKFTAIVAVIVSGIALAVSAAVKAHDYEDQQYYADVYGGDTDPYYGYDFAAPSFYGYRRLHHPSPEEGRFHERLHADGFHGGGFHGEGIHVR